MTANRVSSALICSLAQLLLSLSQRTEWVVILKPMLKRLPKVRNSRPRQAAQKNHRMTKRMIMGLLVAFFEK
mgnify:CR=1 FL=1